MKMKANDLKAALGAGKELKLIDVRTPAEFGEVHLEGSELMPLERLHAASLKSTAGLRRACR